MPGLPTRARHGGTRWTARSESRADGLSMGGPGPLERGDVDGLGALVAGLGVEGHLRALSHRLEAVGVDAGVVDEEVLAALVRGDEAEALVVVEPLHGSGSHDFLHGLCALRTPRKLLRQRLRALNTLSSSGCARPEHHPAYSKNVRSPQLPRE